VRGGEGRAHRVLGPERHLQRGVAALVRSRSRCSTVIASRGTPCSPAPRRLPPRRASGAAPREHRRIQPGLHRRLAQLHEIGQADAPGRQHAGKRRQQHRADVERVGHVAGVLPGRAAEAAQREGRRVGPAPHRDLLDRARHALDRDLDKARRDGLDAHRAGGPRLPRR
jgi:hypothetical protein